MLDSQRYSLHLAVLRFCRKRQRLRKLSYPDSTRPTGIMPSLVSPLALRTQQLVGFRFRATPMAASTPPSAREHSFSMSAIKALVRELKTRRSGPQRSYSTPAAPAIQPLERPPF